MPADFMIRRSVRPRIGPATDDATISIDASRAPVQRLRLRVWYPNPEAIVVAASGEIDATTVGRFEEALLPRLSAAVRLVVVDLLAVHFLGVPGLELLHHARLCSQVEGIALRLVANGDDVVRALEVGGLSTTLERFSAVEAALAMES